MARFAAIGRRKMRGRLAIGRRMIAIVTGETCLACNNEVGVIHGRRFE